LGVAKRGAIDSMKWQEMTGATAPPACSEKKTSWKWVQFSYPWTGVPSPHGEIAEMRLACRPDRFESETDALQVCSFPVEPRASCLSRFPRRDPEKEGATRPKGAAHSQSVDYRCRSAR
jgi:hypothetical protein